MADNVTVDNGALTDFDVATDEDGTNKHHQYVKLEFGADGVFTKVDASNPLPVTGDELQTEDAAYSPGAPLALIGGVRRDADTTPISADGDVHPLVFDEIGRLKVATYQGSVASYTDNITSNGDTVALDVTRYSNLTIHCKGTFSTVNVTFEASIDAGTTWFAVQAVRTNANTIETTTGNLSAAPAYAWELSVNAYTNFRVRATAFTSGTQVWVFQGGTYATEPIPAAQISGTQPVSGTVTASNVTGSAAEDAAIAGNPVRSGGRASTATPTAMSADNDLVTVWLDRSGASVVTGYVAEDGAIVGNPVRQGVRAHSAVPTAMSADNDSVTPWADRSGAQVVIPQPRTVRVAATPTISTSGYAAADQVGGLLTFTSAALASGRAGQVLQAVLTSRTPTALNDLELWLFNASPTLAGSDNAAFDLTDANLEAAQVVGVIDFLAANYAATVAGAVCIGVPLNVGGPMPSFVTSGSANLFGVLVARTVAAQYAGTTDLVVALTVNQF